MAGLFGSLINAVKPMAPQAQPQTNAQPQDVAAGGALVNPPAPMQPPPAQLAPPAQPPMQSQQNYYGRPGSSPRRDLNPLEENGQNNQQGNMYGYPPIPVYDNGGEVHVEKENGVLKKLGDKAKDVVSTLKSIPPSDNEAQALAEKNQQVDEVTSSPAEKAPEGVPDKVAPLAKYGDRPGEKRLDWALKPAPVYDNGGEVKVPMHELGGHLEEPDDHKMTVKAELKPEDYMPRYGSEAAVANRPDAAKPNTQMKSINLYDEGGEVDVNDGKHQAAILKDGERVLTPEENERYKKEHPEEGAPADFSGRVLSNPKGLKPILDTDVQRPSDTDHLPKGASVDTKNAPLETPEGDISNPETYKGAKPGAMHEISAKTPETGLKPYSQVVEEKAKAKAAEQVQNPGAQPVTSDVTGQVEEKPPVEEEKPKATLGQGLAQDWLKKMGATNPGDVVDKMKAPEGFNQGSPEGGKVEEGLTAPKGTNQGAPAAPALKPIVSPEAPAPALSGKDKFKATVQKYDDEYQQLLNKAAETNDPAYKEQALRVKQAEQAYKDKHGWGAAESAHPGVLGKIGHVASRLGEIGANVLAPGVSALVPGSVLGRQVGEAQTEGQLKTAEAATSARETAEKAANDKNIPATAAQVQDYQNRIANSGLTGPALDVYGKVPAGTTPAELDKRFDEATKLRGMDQKDADTLVAEQDRKDRAADTKFQHNQARQDKLKKEFYTYVDTDKDGKQHTKVVTGDKLDDVPDEAELLPVKDLSSELGEGRAMNAVQDSMNKIHEDLDTHPEVFDNAVARGIVQTTTEQMNRSAINALVAGTGGSIPIPSGFGDIINTALQNHTLDEKTSRAVKNYIADYKAMKDKAMVIQMNMQNGKMGRGGQQAFESIVNQMPGGSTPDNATAVRQMEALQKTASTLMGKYPDEYADFKKSMPYEPKSAAKAQLPKEGDTQEHAGFSYKFDGKLWVKQQAAQ